MSQASEIEIDTHIPEYVVLFDTSDVFMKART